MKRVVGRLLLVVLVLLVLIQLYPYGRSHENPAVFEEPSWNTPRTRELAKRACFDCHSNETVWPWYASIAPISWLVQHDVDEGRAHLNFSEFDRGQSHAHDAAEELEEGEMPPKIYLRMHARAELSEAEKDELIWGLKATFGESDHAD